MIVTFDTQEYVKELKEGGFTDEQAETLVKAQKKVISDSMESSIATKGDIHTVVDHILEVKTRLAILEKAGWIIIAALVALILKSYFL